MSGHPLRAAARRRHPNGVIELRSPGSEDDRGPRSSYGRIAARHRAARTTRREDHVHAEELLRRLALNDENVVRSAVGADPLPLSGGPELDAKTSALVRLAALLSIGAATSSCRAAVEIARAAGATDAEIVGVLVAVAPAVGGARVVGAAPRLALAIDYDVEDVAEVWDGR
jgi:alkylhydroperoxidase/carboxymuconolactone decarboxylase family protein YurZ